jgi:DNA-binding GntR family transcriptional regulator/mannitol/fructose-specific phosphotransferase system IIA component (Ntr-type)
MMAMHFQIDRTSSQPIYSQLAAWIETKINSGEWQTEFKFPGEVELALSLGVSRGSLRKAISILIKKGLIVQIHGKGTFVGHPTTEQAYSGRLGVFQELNLLGVPYTTDVLEQRIMPSPEKEAYKLGISPAEAILYLKRLNRVKGDPLVVQESFIPASRFGGLVGEDFTQVGIVETIEKHYGITLEWTSNTISVARATTGIADLLGLKIGDPVLCSESILFDKAGNRIETEISWYRPDRFKLKTSTRRAQIEPFYSMLRRTTNPKSPKVNAGPLSPPQTHSKEDSRLAEFLPLVRISINFQADDWMGAVLQAGHLLFSTGAAEEHYGQAMVNTANRLGPYFVVAPGIAVAHALPSEGVLKPALSMLTLNPPLPFGHSENDPVRLLIAIAAVDTSQHVEALKEIADVLSDPVRQKALMAAESPQEAFNILTRKEEIT